MNRMNGLMGCCIALLLASGCSALTKWPDVNDNTKAGGGNGGEDAVGGAAKGAAGNRGGSPSMGATAGLGGLASQGGSNVAGTSSAGVGSAPIVGGAGNGGGAVASGSASVGSSASLGGATVLGGQGGIAAGVGGNGIASGGATKGGAASVGGATALGGAATLGGAAGSGATSSGVAGGASSPLVITTPSLPVAKTGVAYSATVTASGATTYSWSIASGALPSGVTLQSTSSASVTIAGTPKEAGLFPLKLSVSDGTTTKTVDVSLAVTHKVAFLSDRITSGVRELFLTEVGTETPASPVRLNAPMASGGVTSFAWSPDGTKVAYWDSVSTLFIATAANPGVATKVSDRVSSFVWFSDGNALGYATSEANVYVVEFSDGVSTLKTQAVALPETAATYARTSVDQLIAAPGSRVLGIVAGYRTPAIGEQSLKTVSLAKYASGSTPTVSVLRSSTPPVSVSISFSFDGGLLAQYAGDSGLVVWSTADPTVYRAFPQSSFYGYVWSTRSNSLVGELKSDHSSFVRSTFTGSAWQDSALRDPSSCVLNPGPWSPNGHHVLFRCDSDIRGVANAATAAMNSDFSILPAGFLVDAKTWVTAYDWSPDSRWIGLRANRESASVTDLYLVNWTEVGAATRPYTSSSAAGVSTWQFAPDSRSIAFVGTIGSATTPQLFLSTLPESGTPNPATALTAASTPAVQNDIAWLPGSRVVLYRANDAAGAQLHAVHVGASGTSSTPLSISGTSGSGVPSYAPAPLP